MFSIPTILLFLTYCFGLGYSVTIWGKNSEHFLERNIMRVGIGLSCFVVLGVFFDFINVPIDWKWFLIVSLVVPGYYLYKFFILSCYKMNTNFKLTKTNLYIILALLIFSFSFFMYARGAFTYPYLENDDPWGHAEGVKYVSLEKTITVPLIENPYDKTGVRLFGYLDPYPPGYDMLMGVLHQTNNSINWTLKFFNAFILALGILFFFFFSKEFIGSGKKALVSTFFLSLIPAFMTHFIWAHSLIITVFLVVMYCIERIKYDQRWKYILGIVFAGMLLIQPSQIFKLVPLILIYIGVKWLVERKFPKYYIIGLLIGIVLSLLWWFERSKRMLGIKVGARIEGTASELVDNSSIIELVFKTLKRLPEIFPNWGGSATRVYNFNDFFFAQPQGLINNSVGIGIFVYLLLFIGTVALVIYFTKLFLNSKLKNSWTYNSLMYILLTLNYLIIFILAIRYVTLIFQEISFLTNLWIELIYFILLSILALSICIKDIINLDDNDKPKHIYYLTTLSWLLFTFLFVNSLTFNLPIGLWAFRVWMLFSIPTVLIATEGTFFVVDKIKHKYGDIWMFVFFIFIITGVIFTSGVQKYSINTAIWPPGGAWTSMEEVQAYNWLKENLPPNTKVFPYSSRDGNIIGFDMYSCRWCPEITEFRRSIIEKDSSELHTFLKSQGYEYMMVDGMSVKYLPKYFGYNKTEMPQIINEKINEFGSSELFTIKFKNQGGIVFKLN